MKLRHLLWIVLLAIAAGGVWYAVTLRNQPPEMAFAHVVREPITSSVPTNGKVEPVQSFEAHAPVGTTVKKLLVKEGDRVKKGQLLAQLDDTDASSQAARSGSSRCVRWKRNRSATLSQAASAIAARQA